MIMPSSRPKNAKQKVPARWLIASITILLACTALQKNASAQEALTPSFSAAENNQGGDDEHHNYGPPTGEPRKTLLQWSYGTSLSGGPELDKPLVADRPDFTQSSVTVGRGVLQIESGYTYTVSGHGDAQLSSHSFPESLFRYGAFAEWFELRLEPNFLAQRDITGWNSGMADTYLGCKIALTPQEKWLPEMGILIEGTVPSGSRAFTAGQVLPDVNWVYGWEVNDFLSIDASTIIGSAVDGQSNRPYTQLSESCSIGYQLTKKLHAFTECYGFFPHGAETELPQYYFDCGCSYLFNNNVQWDIRAGLGLSEAADDYFFGMGLTVRIP